MNIEKLKEMVEKHKILQGQARPAEFCLVSAGMMITLEHLKEDHPEVEALIDDLKTANDNVIAASRVHVRGEGCGCQDNEEGGCCGDGNCCE